MSIDSTRTLLFGIFVTTGRRLTAAQLIALAEPFGLSATNVKSHLTRLVAEGALQRAGPARSREYWPSPAHAPVVVGIQARLLDDPDEPWDATWIVLTLRMPAKRAAKERLRASLWFDGFRPWGIDTFARPAWPRAWALERAHAALGRTRGLCVHGDLVGTLDAGAVAKLYDLDTFDREAHRLARHIEGTHVASGGGAAAFVARLTIGGMVARLVGHDPRLPVVLWGERTGRHELVRAFRRFESRVAPAAQRFADQMTGEE